MDVFVGDEQGGLIIHLSDDGDVTIREARKGGWLSPKEARRAASVLMAMATIGEEKQNGH
jgi:hypothetical protein